jgi:hypothetical protein
MNLDSEKTKHHDARRDKLETKRNPPYSGTGFDVNSNAIFRRKQQRSGLLIFDFVEETMWIDSQLMKYEIMTPKAICDGTSG